MSSKGLVGGKIPIDVKTPDHKAIETPDGKVWIKNTKTGSQLMNYVLLEMCHGVPFRVPLDSLHGRHLWSVRRNPYDRAVSTWWACCKNELGDYKRWIAKAGGDDLASCLRFMISEQSKFAERRQRAGPLRGDPGLKCSQVAGMGSIKIKEWVEFDHIETWLISTFPQLSASVIPVVNATRHKRDHWEAYVNEEEALLIEDWAADDFEAFGYKKISARFA